MSGERRASLAQLTMRPIVPLKAGWRDADQARALREARTAECDGGIEGYWAWAARHLRWIKGWDTVREGDFENFTFFSGGLLNVADNCIDRHAETPEGGARTALIWEGEDGSSRVWTYERLRDESCRLANGLLGLGVGKGDVVAIFLPNLPEAFAAVHACNRIGAIYTILFSGFSEGAVDVRLQAAGAKVIVTTDLSFRRGSELRLLETLRRARSMSPASAAVIVLRRDLGTALQPGEVDYAELLERQSPDRPPVPLDANDPAFLIFTSGTEAKPKGLVHSVGGFLVGTWANVRWQIGLKQKDVYWCTADIGWLTFPIQAVIGGLSHGATIVFNEGSLDYPSITRFYEVAERHAVNKLLTAPTVLRMLRSRTERERALPKLELITLQGEPLDPQTFSWASEHFGADGVPVINAYGQTETGSTWTYPVFGVDALKPGSCGSPVPGHRYAIVSEAGTPCATGEQGELVLTEPFPTLARTLWEGKEAFRQKYLCRFPGCFATSDEAVCDADGQLWVLGRADDVINVAAHRISTIELEAAVAATPGVAEAAVVGIGDPIKGTVPIAFVSLQEGADAVRIRIEASERAERAMGPIARLKQVVIVPAFPKSRAGKIVRRLLRDLAETGEPRGDTSSLDDPSTLDAIALALRDSSD